MLRNKNSVHFVGESQLMKLFRMLSHKLFLYQMKGWTSRAGGGRVAGGAPIQSFKLQRSDIVALPLRQNRALDLVKDYVVMTRNLLNVENVLR